MQPASIQTPTQAPPTLIDGDRAAAAGEWSQAIGIWRAHLAGEGADAATQRIRWFLDEAVGLRAGNGPLPRLPQRALFWLGTIFGIVGTACVLLGFDRTGADRNVLASIAWILYLATAVLAVIYAYRSGHHKNRHQRPLSDGDINRAAELAARFDAGGTAPSSPFGGADG